MLRLLMAGMTMEEVAQSQYVKKPLPKRTALYERLGLDNFNEACLFIFRNKLLEQRMKLRCTEMDVIARYLLTKI
jgi:hypothetical protein